MGGQLVRPLDDFLYNKYTIFFSKISLIILLQNIYVASIKVSCERIIPWLSLNEQNFYVKTSVNKIRIYFS